METPIIRKKSALSWIEVYENKVVLGRDLSFNKTSIPIKQIANVIVSTNSNGGTTPNLFNFKSFKWVIIETTGGKTHKIKLRWDDGDEVGEKILELI